MNDNKKKRKYTKPKLKAIDLAAEEVLGVSCKTSTSTGAPHLNSFSCIGSGCHRLGS
ncbi:MAG: hypothetical protein WC799_16295 [Desulfobacteraceae bacterium]